MKLTVTTVCTFLIVLPSFFANTSNADIAVDMGAPDPNFFVGGSASATVDGWEFSPIENILVSALGVYDRNGDGLVFDHPVAIWNNADQSTAIASTVVPPGTMSDSSVAELGGSWRFENINSPVTLLVGQTYTIATFYPGQLSGNDAKAFYSSAATAAFVFDARVGFTIGRTSSSSSPSTLSFPTATTSGLTFGPNFQFQSVPEPSSLALVATSLCLAFSGRRRMG